MKHLHGFLNLVSFDNLFIKDSKNDNENYQFSNPRTLTENGKSQGFEKNDLRKLRESIKQHGLLSPLIGRPVGDKIQIVAGERRYKCLDALIKNRDTVKDFNTDNFISADQAFKDLPVQVYPVDNDIDALKLAYIENDHRVNFNEGHDIAIVIELRKAKDVTDDQICQILDKLPAWLRDTDKLINKLDEETLNNLVEGRINRESAIKLAEIQDLDLRHNILKAANQISLENAETKIKKIKSSLENAISDENEALQEAFDGQEENNSEKVGKAKEKIDEAKGKIEKNKEQIEKVKPVTKSKDVRKALEEVNGDNESLSKWLRGPKIEKHYKVPLEQMIAKGGFSEDGTYFIHEQTLEFALAILNNVLKGNISFPEILEKYAEKPDLETVANQMKN